MSLLDVSLEIRFFSVLVSRLRAAAHALFPPRGEEKESKVEAECHALDKRTNENRPAVVALVGSA
jgi:hypothetical protein